MLMLKYWRLKKIFIYIHKLYNTYFYIHNIINRIVYNIFYIHISVKFDYFCI